jgi:nicotinic acid mononucleotide adenylyltransferase
VYALADVVGALDSAGPIEARWVLPPPAGAERGRVGLLPGSFNPPTDAHVALAEAGRRSGLDTVAYLLSKRTVNKEEVTGVPLADRLGLLSEIAERTGDAVAFVNRGLYVDLARALRAILPDAGKLVFLVGHDKIAQIFDPSYYVDREAALDELFGLASFLVAPRAEAGAAELAALLAEPANARFAGRVQPLALAEQHRHASSSRARHGTPVGLPDNVRRYLTRERPFG